MLYNYVVDRVKLQGFEIDTYDFDGAVEFVKNNGGQVVTINPEILEYASTHSGFADIIKQSELVIPDGIGVQLGLKILGHNVRRIAGVEFAKRLLAEFANRPVALIGAKPHVIKNACANLQKELPSLNIVFSQDGYFNDEEKVLKEVIEKNPQLVLVALGSPKQEEFIYKLKSHLPHAVMVGVGGSFDVWAGEVKRAPEIYQKLGLEWLYRTVKEPKRFKRIFPTLPLFVLKVLKEKWS